MPSTPSATGPRSVIADAVGGPPSLGVPVTVPPPPMVVMTPSGLTRRTRPAPPEGPLRSEMYRAPSEPTAIDPGCLSWASVARPPSPQDVVADGQTAPVPAT